MFVLIEMLKAEQHSTETEVRLCKQVEHHLFSVRAHHHITKRLVRLKQMLLNGDINVSQYAGSVSGVLKLRD